MPRAVTVKSHTKANTVVIRLRLRSAEAEPSAAAPPPPNMSDNPPPRPLCKSTPTIMPIMDKTLTMMVVTVMTERTRTAYRDDRLLLRVMTSRQLAVRPHLEDRLLHSAEVSGFPTTGTESTARWWVHGRWHITFEHDTTANALNSWVRQWHS